MATTDKAKNTADLAQGKLKEAAGAMTGNDKLRAEGKAEQTKANLKQAREKVKDAFRK
ncbi:MAG: CsbD family protein [Acidimicrobiales bacterium]